MKKKFVLSSMFIMLILFIAGTIMILSSGSIGENAGGKAIRARGGSMDSHQYNNIISSTTENFRTSGMIISLVGGLGILMSGYGIYREI